MNQLPAELILAVASAMGSDATVEDWVNVSMVCQAWRAYVPTMFAAWLKAQHLGRPFGSFTGTAAELRFIRKHIDGRCCFAILSSRVDDV
jgi:hypothetical protein